MKKLIASVLALGLMISPAFALNQFFQVNSGQWSIEGYTGDKDFCSAKTYWNDGSYVSLFNMRNSDTFSLYVHNKDWNMNGDIGSYYSGDVYFEGSAGRQKLYVEFELKDSQTIVLRNLTDAFINSWVEYREMTIIMPNDIPNMSMGLTGTRDSIDAFVSCIDILNQ